ncbi:MAG: hypothetical protein VYA55_22655 [Pseudomonadota bacterium]|nr:hypothetical protein [Pseudomonadota bacterium]
MSKMISVCGTWVKVPESGQAVNVPKGLFWSPQKSKESKPLWKQCDEAIHRARTDGVFEPFDPRPTKDPKGVYLAIMAGCRDQWITDWIIDLAKSGATKLPPVPKEARYQDKVRWALMSAHMELNLVFGVEDDNDDWTDGSRKIISEKEAFAALGDQACSLTKAKDKKKRLERALTQGTSAWEKNYKEGNAIGKGRKEETGNFDTRKELETAIHQLESHGNTDSHIAHIVGVKERTVRTIRNSGKPKKARRKPRPKTEIGSAMFDLRKSLDPKATSNTCPDDLWNWEDDSDWTDQKDCIEFLLGHIKRYVENGFGTGFISAS